MISKRGKKIFTVIIIIAMLALIVSAILPYMLYA